MMRTSARQLEEKAMYASLRHYRIEPKNMDELVRRVPGAMEVMSKLNGLGYYVVKAGEDTLATVSIFADKAGAVLSNQAAATWVKENAADLFSGTVDAIRGEVVAYRTGP
jgi:hypothetical protein